MFLPEVQLIYNAVLVDLQCCVSFLHCTCIMWIIFMFSQMVCELVKANVLFGVTSSVPNPACDAQGTVNKIV